jgi:hypothetical protein
MFDFKAAYYVRLPAYHKATSLSLRPAIKQLENLLLEKAHARRLKLIVPRWFDLAIGQYKTASHISQYPLWIV